MNCNTVYTFKRNVQKKCHSEKKKNKINICDITEDFYLSSFELTIHQRILGKMLQISQKI